MDKYFVLKKKVYLDNNLSKEDELLDPFTTLEKANYALEREIYAYKSNLIEISNDLDLEVWDVRLSLTGTLRFSGEITYRTDMYNVKVQYFIENLEF